jgi:hypothetical protein
MKSFYNILEAAGGGASLNCTTEGQASEPHLI